MQQFDGWRRSATLLKQIKEKTCSQKDDEKNANG